ncbi:hypothetical protein NDAWWUGD_CDS0152 [Salmonella phage SeKF_80]
MCRLRYRRQRKALRVLTRVLKGFRYRRSVYAVFKKQTTKINANDNAFRVAA